MGISGLLPALRSVTDQVHISAYARQTIAIDAYAWMHRGAVAHAAELCKDPTSSDAFSSFVLSRIKLLLDSDVKPFLVFDGGFLPAKQAQECIRSTRRHNSLQNALRLEVSGLKSAAQKYYRQAIDITPWMAKLTIDAVAKKFGDQVFFVVAPYEADAQLTWLVNNGHAAAALTEDSDLLPFGCERVLFKLDSTGHVDQICLENIGACQQLDFRHWTLAEFQLMCVLSGCDYVASPKGLGLKTAHKLVARNKSPGRTIASLRLQGKYKIPSNYDRLVEQALLTFRHQRVYDIVNMRLVNLHPLYKNAYADDFLGPDLPIDVAVGIAKCLLDPVSLKPYSEAQIQTSGERPQLLDQAISGKREFQSCFVQNGRITLGREYGVVPKNVLSFTDYLNIASTAPY